MPSATNIPKATPSTSENVESWIEKIVDGEEGSVPRQVFLGGASGWLTGFLAMKVGKAAATAVGGGIILLQIANYKGYININWNRLNRDAEKIQKQIQNKSGKTSDWTDKQENKLNKAADKAEQLVRGGETVSRRWYHRLATGEDLRLKDMQAFFMAYAAGVAIGMISV